MQIPIACSLTPEQTGDRIAEWRDLLFTGVDQVNTERGHARLRLRGTDIQTAASLAQRERECCPFFGFALELDEYGRWWLDVTAPAEAQAVLDDLLSIS